MKRRISLALSFFAAATAASLLASPARAQPYKGVDLYEIRPPDGLVGFAISGVAGGQVVGWSTYANYSDSLDPIEPLLATPPNGETVILSPLARRMDNQTRVYDTDGVQQVGAGTFHTLNPYVSANQHAFLWMGTAESVVDLNPPGAAGSVAYGVGGGQQVGVVGFHAALWSGTAESAVDLHPLHLLQVFSSSARAADGVQQVGAFRLTEFPGPVHAIVWNGTAASGVDLHPTNLGALTTSEALGVGGGQQVGRIVGPATSNRDHAVMWHGSPETAINLHPMHLSQFDGSIAAATNGTIQVGVAAGNFQFGHAMLWTGAPETALDLHDLLPTGFRSSGASSIDAQGRIYGIATALDGLPHAVMWVPVPEPAAIAMALVCLPFAGILRRRTILLSFVPLLPSFCLA